MGPELKLYVFPLPVEVLELERMVSPALMAKVGSPRIEPLEAIVYELRRMSRFVEKVNSRLLPPPPPYRRPLWEDNWKRGKLTRLLVGVNSKIVPLLPIG